MNRTRLPNRRAAELYDLRFKGARYTIGVSRFPDGRLAEAFIHSAKTSSNLADIARDAAVTREADGSPAGIVGAVLDLILEASPQ
jgi:hypothetical protein